MKNNNFGILTEEMYNNFSENEIKKFLIDKKIKSKFYPVKNLEYIETNEKNVDIISGKLYPIDDQFSKKFLSEVYFYLKSFMKTSHIVNLENFIKNFNSNTFGLNKEQTKSTGLEEFNFIFFNLKNADSIKLINDTLITYGSRFEQLKETQDTFISALMHEADILKFYLLGKDEFFNRKLLDSNQLLINIYKFENNLIKLISLNLKFKFEIDTYFTPKSIPEIIFEEYLNEFESLKQLQFLENKLSAKLNQKASFIASIYFFFKDELDIKTPKEKIFREIVNHFYSMDLKRIKLSDSSGNAHTKRIKTFNKDWVKFQN